jgi:hypothetical protein
VLWQARLGPLFVSWAANGQQRLKAASFSHPDSTCESAETGIGCAMARPATDRFDDGTGPGSLSASVSDGFGFARMDSRATTRSADRAES